jgi:GT2 family glycosyltransferase
VTLVDNASTDGSADAVEQRFPGVVVIRNSTNAVGFLERKPAASAVASQLRRPNGSIQPSCRSFPSIGSEMLRMVLPFQLARHLPVIGGYYMGSWRHDDTRRVDQPAGAFLMIRRGAWGNEPLFDERFFMYFEDVDLCRRLWRHGPIWFLAETHAVHIGEHSSDRVRSAMAVALAASRYKYFEKWHGRRAARTVAAAATVASAARSAFWTVNAAVGSDPTAVDRALAHRRAARSSMTWFRAGDA